jgi:hypothetical protein
VGTAFKYDTNGMFDTPPNRTCLWGCALFAQWRSADAGRDLDNQDTHGITSDMSKEQLNDLIEFLKGL